MKINYIVGYIRDWNDRIHGCLVAIDRENIGVCLVKPKGNFSKKEMVKIALERAKNKEKFEELFIPMRQIAPEWGDPMTGVLELPFNEVVNLAYLHTKERAKKWFKDENIH